LDKRKPMTHTQKRKNYWSAAEDEQLKHLVAEHGEDWAAIASCIQRWHSAQCRERWQRYVRPQLSKSEWTPEEDHLIRTHVTEMGKKWAQIRMQYMPSRSDDDIRTRWKSIIQKVKRKRTGQNKRGFEWTPEEDQEILNHVAELGTKWIQIRKQYMPSRKHYAIRDRWKLLLRQGLVSIHHP